MDDLTQEAIAQLWADVADLRFALGCEREALGKAIADYINLQAEVTAIRAENERLRTTVTGLRDAMEQLDRCPKDQAARDTGAFRDALEWVEDAARAVVAAAKEAGHG